jgi:hypothetical protein
MQLLLLLKKLDGEELCHLSTYISAGKFWFGKVGDRNWWVVIILPVSMV